VKALTKKMENVIGSGDWKVHKKDIKRSINKENYF